MDKRRKQAKEKLYTLWIQLCNSYFEWKEKPSAKVAFKILKILIEVIIKLAIKQLLDILF